MNSIKHFTDSQVREYTKKIVGFALLKTGNHHLAEDLTQEILLALLRSLQPDRHIERMDAWVYRICCYTWSNYVAREKRHWRTADIDELELHGSYTKTGPTNLDYAQVESIERMKREAAYLSKLHRDISVMHYYENQSVNAIADKLSIPPGTVKWHLYEARRKIKEGMKMDNNRTETLSMKPVKLIAGHSGTPGPKGEPNIYFDTMLGSNIAVAAYERPVTIEEIARTLAVSSAYVEDYIHKFAYSDLFRKVGKDKYQTNFIIEDLSAYLAYTNYLRTKANELADLFYDCLAPALAAIKQIGFHGSQRSDVFLLWTVLPYAIHYAYCRVKDSSYYSTHSPDERQDGGKYIVAARIVYEDEEIKNRIADSDRTRKYATNGIKSRGTGNYRSLQMDTWWSGMKWREFESSDISDMHRIIELIETGAEHTEYDKELISRMARRGFVAHHIGGGLECLIPFFKADQYEAFLAILETSLRKIEARAKLEQVHDDFVDMWEKLAPSHIPRNEVVYKAMNSGMSIVFAVLEYLEHTGKLALPAEEDKVRLTTLMWLRS